MEYESTKEERFESIYRSYEADVYRACLHLAQDEYLAEEMTQQAFVNFYERFDTLEIECVKGYLIQSAKNLIYNYYRDTQKEWKPDEEEEELLEMNLITGSVEDQYFDEMKKALAKELTDEILAGLKEHNEGWYDMIYKMFILDMSHEEISQELGVTKEVLYSRLHRAKLWIQKNYKENFKKITDTA